MNIEWVGNAYVSIKREDANVFAFITRLHKGVGMSTVWVLLADALAGGLVFLSLTGLLLWTKLCTARVCLWQGWGLASLGLAVFVVLSSL
ncbi:PepSY-associated TM helix domain-containing protein [Methylobacter svalbardensis]|uniref:PepSY-associated TM helix domain-containing protein n=1 Tax=Methylobacter svalbardensis TaxID=3080016 RepID=UPI0030EB67B4